RPSPLRAPRHWGGMMAKKTGNLQCKTHMPQWLTLKVGGAYIPPPRCAAVSARWRTCEAHHRSVVSRLATCWKREGSKPSGRPEGGAGGFAASVCCLKLWIGRKRNVGGGVLADFSSRAKARVESRMRLRRSYVSIHQALFDRG